jgi:hypothetical protein
LFSTKVFRLTLPTSSPPSIINFTLQGKVLLDHVFDALRMYIWPLSSQAAKWPSGWISVVLITGSNGESKVLLVVHHNDRKYTVGKSLSIIFHHIQLGNRQFHRFLTKSHPAFSRLFTTSEVSNNIFGRLHQHLQKAFSTIRLIRW